MKMPAYEIWFSEFLGEGNEGNLYLGFTSTDLLCHFSV